VEPFGTEREVAAMRRAITLAERALGSTSPNPIVGCVILDADQRVVGEGLHERAGGPHAEVVALAEAGERARGGTAVVTLEPCRHTGRTGPCTTAIVEAGITRVVYATADPTPLAQKGAELLRASGVEVVEGLLADEAARSNEAWLHRFYANFVAVRQLFDGARWARNGSIVDLHDDKLSSQLNTAVYPRSDGPPKKAT